MNVRNIKQIDIINRNKSLNKGYVSMVVNVKLQLNTEFLNALSKHSGTLILLLFIFNKWRFLR